MFEELLAPDRADTTAPTAFKVTRLRAGRRLLTLPVARRMGQSKAPWLTLLDGWEHKMEPKAALEAINKALFPPPREEGGATVGGDAYLNLEGVRIDLERMGADRVCIRTIERVQKQLIEVSRVLREAGFQVRRL